MIVFDCDGVLVDSEPISNRVMAEAINQLGLAMSVEEVAREFQGKRLAEVEADVQSRLAAGVLPDGWRVAFERARAKAFARELQPVAGARQVLEAVREASVPRCVASQASAEKTELTLGLTELREFFADVALFSATTVPRGKPHPDVFLLAARSMGHPPECCVVIEDGVDGVLGARAAGMEVLGYAHDGNDTALRKAGARVFSSMDELLPLLAEQDAGLLAALRAGG